MATERPLQAAGGPETGSDGGPAVRALPSGTWVVYMARCRDGSLYTGISMDVTRRIRRHNAGRGGRYTRAHRPVTLVYWTVVSRSRSVAMSCESILKHRSKTAKEAMVAHFARRCCR